jgi:galactokinase/mevalonate kinase-like predicted kinase
VWWELESRLVLVYVGSSHSSSEVHRMVIRSLEHSGIESPKLEMLRRCAEQAKDNTVHFGGADHRTLWSVWGGPAAREIS